VARQGRVRGKESSPAGRLAALVWLALLTAATARAGDEGPCAAAATTAAMRGCEEARLKRAEDAMAAAYAALERRLPPLRQEKLRGSQRAWLRFRDADTAFQASAAEGGTLAPLLETTARADLTEARTTALERALDSR